MDKFYREVATILERASNKESSLRTLIYSSKFKNKKHLLKLCCETAKHRPYLEKIMYGVPFFAKQPGIDGNPFMALVVLYELVIGNGLNKCGAKLKACAIRLTNSINREVKKLKAEGNGPENMIIESKASPLPRYVRINTLSIKMEDCLETLKAQGYQITRLKKTISPKKFKIFVEKLAAPKVYVDPHVESLLIFPKGSDLHNNELVKNGALILQDKASCLSAFVLNATPGTHAMDVCAAPGMKTSHLAAIMKNKGKIFAFDRDQNRTKTLSQMLESNKVKIAEVKNADFLKINVLDKRYEKVAFAIVDPPCSGSGIAKRGEFFDEFDEPDLKRIRTLANLQSVILKHALKLPNLKRLVYSTCSIHREENEGVVMDALNDPEISKYYQVCDPLPAWKHRGVKGQEDDTEFIKLCLRADPETDLTNGFFVALFERKNT